MKNVVLSIVCLFLACGVFAQSETTKTPAQLATEKWTPIFKLDEKQQAEMLKIQERLLRNLAEVEPLKAGDPAKYAAKISGMQHASDRYFEKLLTKEQLPILQKQRVALREKKAVVKKEMMAANMPEGQITLKMAEIDAAYMR